MSSTRAAVEASPCRWFKLERFEGWAVVPRTYVSTEDRAFYAYFIVSPGGERCALIHNDFAIGTFATAQCCQASDELSLGELESLAADSSAFLNQNEDDEDEQNETDDNGEDLSGIDLDFVMVRISPDGQRVLFAAGNDGKRFIFLDGKCIHTDAAMMFSFFSENSLRTCLGFEEEVDGHTRYFYRIGEEDIDGVMDSGLFTPDGKYFVSIERPVHACKGLAANLALDGVPILEEVYFQRWTTPGSLEDPDEDGDSLLMDTESRSVLFGIWEKGEDDEVLEEGEDGPNRMPVLMVYSFKTGTFTSYRGVRILCAENSVSGDTFDVIVATAEDGFRAPRKICYKRGE